LFFFYCPHCGNEKEVAQLPRGTVGNIRDGYGTPIYHFKCEQCSNLDAGYMRERDGNDNEKRYYRDVISRYQGIRGFDKPNIGR
jgi:hypothetical protein